MPITYKTNTYHLNMQEVNNGNCTSYANAINVAIKDYSTFNFYPGFGEKHGISWCALGY